ncbi:acyltransferase [Telmatocola sphagniphila]|uniref:Acyltransferase n=1 Tax=Telmatocola sphagniphila TaxID=1123043 RepID=A0A8E6B572_9BACT|nr:acyltransferase [Telmatocola sphagniphila]QVL31326.1 acyltransferase [Telmatocola sphagniphila]
MASNADQFEASKPTAGRHLEYLDGLRALAALYVVVHHVVLQVNPKFSSEVIPGLATYGMKLFYFGNYAVDIFIVLSGFCLMRPVVQNGGKLRLGAIEFYKGRCRRIVLPYLFSVALSLVLISLLIHDKTERVWDKSLQVTMKSFIAHLFLVQDLFFEDHTINYVLWSIAVEWRIYFLFPLLVLLWRKIGAVRTTILATLSSWLLFEFFREYYESGLTAHYIGLFAFGMLGAKIAIPTPDYAAITARIPWRLLTIFLLGGLGMAQEAEKLFDRKVPDYVCDYIVGLWAMVLLILASRREGNYLRRLLSLKPLVFLGSFAYSIYLIHAPIIQILWQYPFASSQDPPERMLALLVLIGVPLILAFSYLFFLAFERPFLRKI